MPREREARPPQPVTLEKVLMVEGDTPAHFFEALAKKLGLEKVIEIRNYRSITELGIQLRVLASTADFQERVKSLGIVRDAEQDVVGAHNAVRDAIASADLDGVNVTFRIVPDAETTGMLETLCLRSVAEEPVYECIDAFMTCAESKGARFPTTTKRDKNVAQIYLATHKDVEMFPGIAASRGCWPFGHATFDDLKAFLQAL